MQHNSVSYTVRFAAIICVVCSLLVSSSATFLKKRQEENVELDKHKNVYVVSNPDLDPKAKVDIAAVADFFEYRVETLSVSLPGGSIEGSDADSYDVYEVFKTKDKKELDCLILPVEGLGLWGTLYGYLALEKDGNTIRGLTFYEDKETPGLGGEVNNPKWKAKWKGRKAYRKAGNEEWEAVIRVIKGPAGDADVAPHEVDGLSGATITSNSVTRFLQNWLGPEGFGPYVDEIRAREDGSNT